MSSVVNVSAAALGLCEHCGALLNMCTLPADAVNGEWRCPTCRGVLSHVSFGYDRPEKGAQKVRWVGPDGAWTDQKPVGEFQLGNLFVL